MTGEVLLWVSRRALRLPDQERLRGLVVFSGLLIGPVKAKTPDTAGRLVRSPARRGDASAACAISADHLNLLPPLRALLLSKPITPPHDSRFSAHTENWMSHLGSSNNASGKLPQLMVALDEDGVVDRLLIMLLIFAVSLFGTSHILPLQLRSVLYPQSILQRSRSPPSPQPSARSACRASSSSSASTSAQESSFPPLSCIYCRTRSRPSRSRS